MRTAKTPPPREAELNYGHKDGPPGVMSFGHEVDLTDATSALGDKVIIMGNVELAEIQMSPPEKVWELTRDAVLKGKDAPLGYVLMAGCEVPVQAPRYNIFTMLKRRRCSVSNEPAAQRRTAPASAALSGEPPRPRAGCVCSFLPLVTRESRLG